MGREKRSLLSHLKRTIKKVSFVLNFTINKWRVASMVRAGSGRCRLSFNDRPGLRACCEEEESGDSIPSRGVISRTFSLSEDNIDQKADMFIANFRQQLMMERQISMQLRYCRGDSF